MWGFQIWKHFMWIKAKIKTKIQVEILSFIYEDFPPSFWSHPPLAGKCGRSFHIWKPPSLPPSLTPPTPASFPHADASNIFNRGDIFSDFQLFSPLFTVASPWWSDDKMQIRKVVRLKKSADIDSQTFRKVNLVPSTLNSPGKLVKTDHLPREGCTKRNSMVYEQLKMALSDPPPRYIFFWKQIRSGPCSSSQFLPFLPF